jgi:hypothetical protein
MVQYQTTLTHHLFQIAIRKLITAIPADTQQNERRLEVTSPERGLILFHKYASRGIIDELKEGL